MKQKLIIGVEVYQLIVTGVHSFKDMKEAEAWFKDYTGVPWANAYRDEGLHEDYDQTKLFEIDVETSEHPPCPRINCNVTSGCRLYGVPGCRYDSGIARRRRYINNLRISPSKRDGVFRVITPDGRQLEEFKERPAAEEFASKTLDFRRRKPCSTLRQP